MYEMGCRSPTGMGNFLGGKSGGPLLSMGTFYHDLYKDGLTDRDVCDEDSCEPKEPCIGWGADPPREGALLRGFTSWYCTRMARHGIVETT